MSPLFLLHLAPYLIPLHSLYSPIPHPLASNSPIWISKPAWRHLYIHLSISPFLLPSLFSPSPFFSLFSLRAKGKLAASFSLPKGLFKLETLQSPHSPSFPFLSPSFAFLTSFSRLRVTPTFPRRQPLGSRQCQTTLFCRWKWWKAGLEGERKRGRGKVEVGEWEFERGQGRPVSQCTLVPSPSHGSFHPD